jgi:hypothetical protein
LTEVDFPFYEKGMWALIDNFLLKAVTNIKLQNKADLRMDFCNFIVRCLKEFSIKEIKNVNEENRAIVK